MISTDEEDAGYGLEDSSDTLTVESVPYVLQGLQVAPELSTPLVDTAELAAYIILRQQHVPDLRMKRMTAMVLKILSSHFE
jgi:hypothetical protein